MEHPKKGDGGEYFFKNLVGLQNILEQGELKKQISGFKTENKEMKL